MPKLIPEEECPKGLPGWLATFGDLMSLLLTFFVLLLSFSTINVKDFNHAMGALQGALGVLTGEPQLSLPIREELPRSEGNLSEAEVIAKATQELEVAVEEAGLQGDVKLEETTTGIVVRIADNLFFDSAEADLKTGAFPLLRKLGEAFAKLPNHVNIQGHTDSRPINTENYASNWELSGMRALQVAKYLVQQTGLPPDRVSISGFSEYRPLAPNNSETNMRTNRRVEIHILYRGERETTPKQIYRAVEDEGVPIEGREHKTRQDEPE